MNDVRVRAAYRRLLRLLPPHLRDRYGREVEDAFLAEWRRARHAGAVVRAWVWIRGSWDVLHARSAFRHRRLTRPERTPLMLGPEFRAAWRALHRQRVATLLIVGMLSLGVGGNVVVFSLVNDLFLKPFPFPEPGQLMYVNETAPRWNLDVTNVQYADFVQWRKAATTVQAMALYDDRSVNLADARGTERVTGSEITYDFFDVLQVAPLLGRTFTPEEDRPNGPPVVLISESMWRDRFGRDPGVLGHTLSFNGTPHVIVGVMPARAEFPAPTQFWTPLGEDPTQGCCNYSYDAIARAKPGVTAEAVDRDLRRAHEHIWQTRDTDRIVAPFVRPLREHVVREYRTVAGALTAAVVVMLVVACANIAAVMLARAIARRREVGIRLAIGASRRRLVHQLLAENLLLAAAGGAVGLVAGRWALRVLVASVPGTLPAWASFAFDWRVAAFSIAVAAGAALLFGCVPALHAVRGDFRTAMSDAVTGATASPRGRRTLTALVAAEFALAALLLAGAGLLVRAFKAIERVDPGYAPERTLLFSAALPSPKYTVEQYAAFWERATARFRAAPGVDAAGVVNCPPLTCHLGNFFQIEGRVPLAPGEPNPVVLMRAATAGYFDAMGIRLAQGRFFAVADDTPGRDAPIVVNEAFVRTFWPGDPHVLGKRVALNGRTGPGNVVVGVARDVKHYGLDRPMRPGVYFPARQVAWTVASPVVVIRTAGDPMAFAPTARAIMRDLDPTLPLFRVTTGEQILRDHLRPRAAYSWLLAVFAGVTLILAIGGTYGVTTYLVAQRTREIGIRLAIGARTSDITRAILRTSLPAIVAGVAAGLLVAALAARELTDLLFGIPPHDPAVLALSGAALVLAGIAANWIPARRAARADPIGSLRA